MNELAFLQNQLQAFILGKPSSIAESIVATECVGVDTRLQIYSEAYKLRLIESLTTSFTGLHIYLGTEAFSKLCSDYIDAEPSRFRSIRWYGESLAQFLTTYYKKDYAFVAELAEFEWKMTLAFDAADTTQVQVQDMATVPPEAWSGLQFIVHPSVNRMHFMWNAVPLWQALVKDEDLPTIEKTPQPISWVMWRTPEYQIQFYSLSDEEAWAVDAVIQGLSFGELCEGLCQWIKVEEVGMRAASYLKGWIQKGMLAKLIIEQ